MVNEKEVAEQFFDYITERDDSVTAGKRAALEESIIKAKEEGSGDLREELRNPNNAPTGNYFVYDINEIEFCCDEMRKKEGTKDLLLIANRVEGEGLNRLWYCNCTYCGAPLILSRTRLRIDIGRKSL